MKTISSYILEDELLNNVYLHVLLEFKFNHDLYPIMFESLGKFDNANNVIRHILNALEENLESQTIDCSEDKVYFKFIDIKLNHGACNYGAYIKYENETVYIELGCKDKEYLHDNIDKYANTLVHELLHGYEDYNRITNNKSSMFLNLDDKYKNSFNNLNSYRDLERYMARCNYFLNSQERNAYLSQLENDIESLFKNDNIDIENFKYSYFKDKLKNSGIWKKYFELAEFVNFIYNSKLNDDQKSVVEKTWKTLYDEDKHFSDIRKEIYTKWNKFERKFEQLVPKIICKHITTKLNEVYVDVDKIR